MLLCNYIVHCDAIRVHSVPCHPTVLSKSHANLPPSASHPLTTDLLEAANISYQVSLLAGRRHTMEALDN